MNSYFVLKLPTETAKSHRQIREEAMESAFIISVSRYIYIYTCVCVRKWENKLVQLQHNQQELYFRFRDDVFLATKLSTERMEDVLEKFE